MKDLFLAEPNIKYQKSFQNYALAYRKINDEHYFNKYKKALENFQDYLNDLHNYSKGKDLPHEAVATSTFWLVSEKEVVGVVRIRHQEVECAGHIGYDISPNYRNRGYGLQILKLALEKAIKIGMEEVILTCNINNTASKKIIEKNNGKLLGTIFDEEENEWLYKYSINIMQGSKMMNIDYTDINSATIDSWVDNNWQWGIPISHEDYVKATKGEWKVVLTPVKPVPKEWFPNFKGCKVLGLASGGGQQMPVFSALGAECTVMDYSQKQLDSELMVSKRESYSINIVKADMTQQFPFEDESFDMIFHPVSNCYIEDVLHVWKECFRVLKKGGLLIAGMDNGMNYVFDDEETDLTNKLPFNPLKDNELYKECMDKNLGIQFSHTIEEQIGGQLKAGFILTDLYEDTNGSGRLHEYNVPTFIATRAIKK